MPIEPYLPSFQNLADLGISWLVTLALFLVGTGIVGRQAPAPIRIGAGWGALCVGLTLWGVFVPISLGIPAAAFLIGAVAVAILPSRRPDPASWRELGRMAVLSVPLFLVLAPIRPAEPDTWLNLLPNAAYLVDYGRLPTASLPASHSFLPAAPYSTQFLSYLGGLADPDFPAPGMSLMNLVLLLAGGALLARIACRIEPGEAPGWGATALGLLLATLLNPGFVPRVHLSAYGETGLAVTALMAAWLAAAAQTAHRDGDRSPGMLLPLGLVLAAMVGIKQSGFGLVAACVGAAALVGLAERAIPPRRTLAFVIKAIVPAVTLYLVWRLHVAISGVDELKPLPFSQWQWANIPAILASMGHTVLNKGIYFGLELLALVALPVLLRRDGWTRDTRLLAFNAALLALYSGFLCLTYIGHFPGAWSTEAHSFYRYETHLSLVLVAALAVALRAFGLGAWAARHRRPLAAAAITVALAVPIAAVRLLRFDIVMPQPLVWDLAKSMAPYIQDRARLALLLPGDNGSVATMLTGVLEDTAPRRRDLDILTQPRADAAALADAAKAGYDYALVSCTGEGMPDIPAHRAVLLHRDAETWRPLAIWPYPAAGDGKWQRVLAWPPLCRED